MCKKGFVYLCNNTNLLAIYFLNLSIYTLPSLRDWHICLYEAKKRLGKQSLVAWNDDNDVECLLLSIAKEKTKETNERFRRLMFLR
jgi:hypothetical protein